MTGFGGVVHAVQSIGRFAGRAVPGWAIRTGLALLLLVVVWRGSRLLVETVRAPLEARIERPSRSRALLRGVRLGMVSVGVFVALGVYGVEPRSLGLAATVLVAGAGVVVTPFVRGFVEGASVLNDQAYEMGDMVELPDIGHRGFIETITLRYTKVFTLDNTFLVIPNDQIRDRDVLNESAEDPRTWLSLDLLVTYESDLDEARAVVERAATGVDGVVSAGRTIRIGSARYTSAPTCVIDSYAENGVSLKLVYWVVEPYARLPIRSAILENVRRGFDGADVEFAYPHTHLVPDQRPGSAEGRR